MGTLGCINDMLRRDKENRELRKRSKECLSETHNRLLHTARKSDRADVSLEHLERVTRQLKEREELEHKSFFRGRIFFLLIVLLIGVLFAIIISVII